MMVRLALAAGLVAGTFAFAPVSASAAPLAPQAGALSAAAAEATLIEKAQWGRCRYWRRVCGARWGWATPRFSICMARRAC